jgi:hypothetical protein
MHWCATMLPFHVCEGTRKLLRVILRYRYSSSNSELNACFLLGASMSSVTGASIRGAVHFVYFAVLLGIGCQCEDCVYSRVCALKEISVASGLCNGTKFSIRACEFHGFGSLKIKNFVSGVSVISTLTTLNCTDEIDHACKTYFSDSQVHFSPHPSNIIILC